MQKVYKSSLSGGRCLHFEICNSITENQCGERRRLALHFHSPGRVVARGPYWGQDGLSLHAPDGSTFASEPKGRLME